MTALLLGLALMVAGPGAAAWPQWGGPDRNFRVADPGIAAAWGPQGPPTIWRRPLGDGFSAIVGDGETVYTLFREGDQDVAVALRAATGESVWTAAYAAPFEETCSERLGQAPRASPLIAGDRLITVSAGAEMRSFDRHTGARQWHLQLVPPSSDAQKPCGYASSPLLYKDTVLTLAGGAGRAVVAVDVATGRQRWASQDFLNGYSSPLLIDVGGRMELVVFTAGEVSGLDPDTGTLEWSVPHPADYGVNVALPVYGDDRLLFVSSAYNGGSRVLELTRTDTGVQATERWAHKRVRIHFGNAVRLEDRVYASSGDFGSAPFAAVDVTTGDIVWRDRAVARSSLIAVGSQLLILDEDGTLVLATPGPDGLQVHGTHQVFSGRAWTPPTLIGTRLFVRDRKEIVALDLSK